jgi:predicted lactoylglutathione lyase
MVKQLFVNLPVKDLTKTMEFFGKLGFTFNQQFTNENAACMIIGENIYAMLLVEEFFRGFINKEISDYSKTAEVILALSAENRAEVDELADKALAAGGSTSADAKDHGFMYVRSFQDLDGHLWEIFYMDPTAVNPA